LIDEIKNGVVSLDFFNNYSVVIINIDSRDKFAEKQQCKINTDGLENFERVIVKSIREIDIPIRSCDNEIVIITPVVKKNYLRRFIKRIENQLQQKNISMNMRYDIYVGASSNDGDLEFIDVLRNAHRNLYDQKRRLMLLKLEKEKDILNRIEIVREELNNMVGLNKNNIYDDEIVEMSQYLDKLLVEYMRDSGEMSNEREKQ